MVKAKKSKAKKSRPGKSKTRAKASRPASKQTRKAAKGGRAAKAQTPKKATAKKRARKQRVIGEGDYQASRSFLKDQGDFVKSHQAQIPRMGKAAERAMEGPEGKNLRAAEEEGAALPARFRLSRRA